MVCPLVLKAQSDTAKVKLLNEVQIKAKRFNLLQASPTPVQKLGGDELKRLNSLSVADAIRYFSGVQLKDYGGVGGLKTINVRSMGSNHTA
ncbi:MAG: Plug domain-containing protein, partial [Pedobacter sp.]